MKAYGFIYDKQGNLKEVNPPVTISNTSEIVVGNYGAHLRATTTIKTVPAHKKVNTGKIVPTVGHPGF